MNGRQIPSDPYTPQFEQQPPLIAREYAAIFMNTGAYRTDRGNCITLRAFQDGSTVFPFDLSPDLCNRFHLHESKTGDITVELAWETPLTHPITVIAHTSYDEVYVHKKEENEFRIETI